MEYISSQEPRSYSLCFGAEKLPGISRNWPQESKKQYGTGIFSKEILEFSQGHRRLWPCETSSMSLPQLLLPYHAIYFLLVWTQFFCSVKAIEVSKSKPGQARSGMVVTTSERIYMY